MSANSFAIGTEYKIKAAYLYQFTKFTHWPDRLFKDETTPLTICVLGQNPFDDLLNSLTGRNSQNRKLEIRYSISIKTISDCQVVFISKSEEKKLPQILKIIQNSPVLSVSDMDNFARRGGIIGFVPKHKKVGIEINVAASRTAGAQLSSKLLEISSLVQGDLVQGNQLQGNIQDNMP